MLTDINAACVPWEWRDDEKGKVRQEMIWTTGLPYGWVRDYISDWPVPEEDLDGWQSTPRDYISAYERLWREAKIR